MGLGLLMLLLWGRLLLKQPAHSAVAHSPAQASSGLDAADGSRVGAVLTAPVVQVDLPRQLERDLFDYDAQAYPPAKMDEPAGEIGEKLPVEPVDERAKAQRLVEQLTRGLVLQTTILGDRPRALINGRFLEPGGTVNGLTLQRIQARQVILVKDGIEVRLGM